MNEIIKIDDFIKVEMRVGTIKTCEPVEGSSKLYRLMVDLGEFGERQIFAGVAKFFAPEELVGKQGICVSNLEPRKMMGSESQGMMLFAKDDQDNFSLVTVSGTVVNGTRIT